ncbi:hypothetical protein [Psychromarinibacter sp. S121]|uniref:hypothetical protein n=1 Tax=Psychromarinibacter sp. S121 TaxID=3415127 RepID=UPI003C7D6A8B
MFKIALTAAAFALTAVTAQAATPADALAFNTLADLAPVAAETSESFETSYYCEWVTVYDYYGNWITVWQCY